MVSRPHKPMNEHDVRHEIMSYGSRIVAVKTSFASPDSRYSRSGVPPYVIGTFTTGICSSGVGIYLGCPTHGEHMAVYGIWRRVNLRPKVDDDTYSSGLENKVAPGIY